MARQEANDPMREDTIFRIASQTKALTSVAVMMLMEEGKLVLDDPLGKFLPEWSEDKCRRGEGGRRVRCRAGEAPDHHSRPAHAHRGHFLRHRTGREGVEGCRRLWLVFRRQARAGVGGGGSHGETADGGPARRAMGLWLQHRHSWRRGGEAVGTDARPVPAPAADRAARDERYVVLPAPGEGRPLCRGLFGEQRKARAGGKSGRAAGHIAYRTGALCRRTVRGVRGRRGAAFHGRRLFEIPRDAAQWRRARWQALSCRARASS